MRWFWQKKRPPAALELPQAPAIPIEPAEIDLADLSMDDLAAWLGSPFWAVLCQWLDLEIETNRRILENGDIHLVCSKEPGLMYRSDEGLRGGILGMSFARDLFPVQIVEEIAAAREERAAMDDGQENVKEEE